MRKQGAIAPVVVRWHSAAIVAQFTSDERSRVPDSELTRTLLSFAGKLRAALGRRGRGPGDVIRVRTLLREEAIAAIHYLGAWHRLAKTSKLDFTEARGAVSEMILALARSAYARRGRPLRSREQVLQLRAQYARATSTTKMNIASAADLRAAENRLALLEEVAYDVATTMSDMPLEVQALAYHFIETMSGQTDLP